MSERRSQAITEGDRRAPNRSMLRAVGFDDAAFQKPIVGVANAHSNLTPCNAGIGALSERAMAALREAGVMPQVFGTITVADGISMGTEGMKYSLVSREVIADSIETVVNGQSMDAVLAVGGCDKNMPGALIAFARLDVPAIFVYGGTIKPGCLAGRDLTIVSVFEALGQFEAGKLPRTELDAIERAAIPGAGACGGMFTANTMSSAIEALGMSLPRSSTMAAEDAEKAESAAESARVLAAAVASGLTVAEDPDAPGLRERDRGGDGGRRLDERRAAPAGDRPRRRRSRSRSTTSRRSAARCRCCATSSPPAATSRPTSTAPAACRR